MFLTGLATAVPPHRYTQAECWSALQQANQLSQLSLRSQLLMKNVLSADNGIVTRHFAMENLDEAFLLTPNALAKRFSDHAPSLAVQAAERALIAAGLSAAQIDAVIISTCTGYLCPGLTSYVSERLGLRHDALALDLVGQGCGAAIPNWRTAEALLSGHRASHILSVCVEICSAAFYFDNDPGVLISACLFGDGAGAAVLSAQPRPQSRRVEWRATNTTLDPAQRDLLRFELRDGMLRNILSRQVPQLASVHVKNLLSDLLLKERLTVSEISGWILHAGGREVLAAVQSQIGLTNDNLRLSTEILRDYGNVSSPFVLFVLERALATGRPGGWWWLSSFGAGFSCHSALLKVD